MEEIFQSFFFCFIIVWLIILQVKSNKLSEKIERFCPKEQKKSPLNQTKESSFQRPVDTPPSTPPQSEQKTVSEPAPIITPATVAAPVSAPVSPKESTEKPVKEAQPVSFVQLFSWIGGFILLLGVLFSIKYALEKDLISPALRVALGTLIGIGMWTTGALMRKPQVKTTSDTLCACGLCICYAVWFAAYYFYHLLSPSLTLGLLFLISLSCFATAVWKNAQYIGILAQLVGFVTPFLFRSETPHIWFLLVYTGLINLAAIAAAIKRNWTQQLFTGMAFTFLCFLAVIFTGNSLQITLFPALFISLYATIATWRAQHPLLRTAFAFATVALILLGSRAFAVQTDILPYLLTFSAFFAVGFAGLAFWKKQEDLCFCALFFTLLSFCFVAATPSFITLFAFVGLLSFFFGLLTYSWGKRPLQVASMVLTALGFVVFLCHQPQGMDSRYLPYLAGFSVFFSFLFGLISYKQKNPALFLGTMGLSFLCFVLLLPFRNEIYLTALAAFFTLLFGILSAKIKNTRLQLSSVLLTAICILLICALGTLNLHIILSFALAAMVFYGCFAVKQKNGPLFAAAATSLLVPFCVLSFYALFHSREAELIKWLITWDILATLTPIFFKSHFENSKSAWLAVAGCNLVAGFLLLICQGTGAFPSLTANLSFLLAFLYALVFLQAANWQKLEEGNQRFRLNCLAWAPIVFLTLGIALRFTNAWMTAIFAMEAFLLIASYHIVQLNLLQNTGLSIFVVVLIRLLLNPFVLEYFEGAAPIFNGYLYTYLFCATMLFAAAAYWRKTQTETAANFLRVGGGLLLFALVNIEIANSFANGGPLSFNFCGEVAEAAAYTIAWALCGAICMFCTTRKMLWLLQVGIGLIGFAVLKLFVSDIWQLSAGLRITVLIGVAFIMLGISFIYQQFKKTNI